MTVQRAGRPVALVTGVGRTVGIGASIALRLARHGWDVATTHWTPYDDRMPWGRQPDDVALVAAALRDAGAASVAVSADLTRTDSPATIFDAVEAQLGPVTALVLCHAESVDSSILDTTVESFDRHFAVNTRASWLLIREFANRYAAASGLEAGRGRIVALTSDHTVHNLPYGASKGALDRIVIAAARELAELRITSNVINPGPIDTGWMSDELRERVVRENPRGRAGQASDTAALVSFICSEEGGWINGQLLHSDGGLP
jgi:3-oxoacyl-[acyl-carrier protein] reductase